MSETALKAICSTAFIVATVMSAIALTGCESPFADTRFDPPKSVAERIHRIEAFDRQAMTKATQPQSNGDEAAEPPPPPLAELTLSIEECRASALETNLDLQVQLLDPTIARQDITEAEAAFESLFFANASYAKTDTPTATLLSGTQIESLNADAGVTVPLRTGGAITIDAPISRFSTNNVFSILNPAYTSDLSLSISHPLLRNAGRRTNEHPIRIAQIGTQIVEARTKLAVIRVLADVDRVYWQLYAARRELEVRQQELELAQALLERARRQVAAGALPEVEIVRAEAGVAERLEAIIIAENNVRDRQRDLKRIINRSGLTMDTPTILIPATQPNPMRFEPDARRLTAAAIDNRMEMLELELQLLQDASNIDFNRNQLLPLVTADYRYIINGLGGSLGNSVDLAANKEFEDHVFGLSGQVPIGNEAARSRLRRALLARVQRIATKQQRETQITQEVLTAVDAMEAAWQRILAARQRTVLAARVVEAEQRQFEQGLRTSTEVLDAQTRLADARSAEISALTEYQITQVDIAFATGTLLGSTHIRWEPIEPPLPPDAE